MCTIFKKETGTTVNQYITDCRMERACELLSDPRQKISEIASMTGFRDSSYFGKVFRSITGLTPSEYREKNV